MKPLNVLVWAVYPPTAGWRGEGITQTVENILLNAPPDVKYTLVLSAAHLPAARETLAVNTNVRLISFGFNFRKLKVWTDVRKLLLAVAPVDGILMKIERYAESVGDVFVHTLWRASLPFASLFITREIKASDIIYNPSPVYALTSYKKKPKVFSFWDPFGFEYSAFGKSRKTELHKFLYKFFTKARGIITQSNANMQYLQNVWRINANSIAVIYNGSPVYSETFANYVDKNNIIFSRQNVLTAWPRRSLVAYSKYDALDTLLTDTLNMSVLFRLVKGLKSNSKIIMISTQYRPYKGFEALFNIFDDLIKKLPDIDFRFVITAEFPEKIRDRFNSKYSWETERLYELTRLTNLQHACLYKISDLVLHPSFAEGGPTQYPASEAASLGIPSLTNRGRHTDEMIDRDGPELNDIVADFLDKEKTIDAISILLKDESARSRNVNTINSSRINWKDAGFKYASFFKEIANKARN